MAYCLRNSSATVRSAIRGIACLYREEIWRKGPILDVPLHAIVGGDVEVTLSNFVGRDGNVSLYELLAIGAIVRRRQPRVLLEIGTFDGNTTLQMANNSPDDARIYTLDLPPGGEAERAVDPRDLPYIADQAKLNRKYQRSPQGRKVVQCLGDSATFDFHSVLGEVRPELALIDGSHSYAYVKSDTERVLDILAPDGVVLWHDYAPTWPGVMQYLAEQSRSLPLGRIAGTSLVYMDGARRGKPGQDDQ